MEHKILKIIHYCQIIKLKRMQQKNDIFGI